MTESRWMARARGCQIGTSRGSGDPWGIWMVFWSLHGSAQEVFAGGAGDLLELGVGEVPDLSW